MSRPPPPFHGLFTADGALDEAGAERRPSIIGYEVQYRQGRRDVDELHPSGPAHQILTGLVDTEYQVRLARVRTARP